MGSLNNFGATEEPGFKRLAESSIRFLNTHAEHPAQLMHYYSNARIDDSNKTNFHSAAFLSTTITCNADNTITLSAPTLGYPYSENDIVYFNGSQSALPPELSKTTAYYLVDVTGVTAKLAISPSGSPIAFSAAEGVGAGIHIKSYALINYAGQNGSYMPYAGHYIYEAFAALQFGKFHAASTINHAYLTKTGNFLANGAGHAGRLASYPTSSLTPAALSYTHEAPPAITSPPVFTSSCPGTATQDAPYTCALSATDPENEPLSFSIDAARNTCSWINISGSTLSGTPGDPNAGVCLLGLKVTDGGNVIRQEITVSVSNVPPTLSVPPAKSFSGLIGAHIVLGDEDVVASEEGNGVFTLIPPPSEPACDDYGLVTIDSLTGEVRFTPDADPEHSGECYVTIRFDDENRSGIAEATTQFTVIKTPTPAELVLSGPSPAYLTTLADTLTQDVSYTIRNVAPETASHISAAAFSTPHFSIVTAPCSTLAGGASCNIVVRFTSSALLAYSDALRVNYTSSQGENVVSKAIAFAGIDTRPPNAPGNLVLAASTTGRLTRPTIRVEGVTAGDRVRLFSDSCANEIGSALATGSAVDVTVDANRLNPGESYVLRANSTDAWSNVSPCSSGALDYETPEYYVFDASFDNDGGFLQSRNQYDRGYKILRQIDGRLLLIGQAQGDISVMRVNSDGTLDNTFDSDGFKLATSCTGRNSSIDAALSASASSRMDGLIHADGRIVVLGSCYTYGNAPSTDAFMMRLNSNGSFDTSFNGTGYLRLDLSGTGREDYAFTLGVTSEGKYIVGGTALNESGNYDAVVTRVHSNGTLDSGYRFQHDSSSDKDVVRSLKILPDNSVIVAGRSSYGGKETIFLAKLTPFGTLDPTFSNDGIVTTDFGQTFSFRVDDLEIQPDGKLVLSGNTSDNKTVFVARFSQNGSEDSTFSGDGLALAGDSSDSFGTVTSFALHSSGDMILAASSTSFDTKLFRLHSDGSFDKSISPDGVEGAKGKLISNSSVFSGSRLTPADLIIDTSGKLVFGGTIDISGASDFGVLRIGLDYITP